LKELTIRHGKTLASAPYQNDSTRTTPDDVLAFRNSTLITGKSSPDNRRRKAGYATDAARFSSFNADEKGCRPTLSGVKHGHRTAADAITSVGKADPLALVLIEELVAAASTPLVLARRVDLPGDLRGQLVGMFFTGHLGQIVGTFVILQPSLR